MKHIRPTIFRKFAVLIFCLVIILGLLFIGITYFATTYYHEASTELLNKDVAAHIAKFSSPYSGNRISKDKADSVFQNAMILSPAVEVYFLDTTGKVLYYHASEKEIKNWNVNIAAIRNYLATKGQKYIKGTDPKDPKTSKIFSASEVKEEGITKGYIYVILDSKDAENTMSHLFGSHVMNLALQAFGIMILLSLLFSLLYLKRISKNFVQITSVLERYESGDYTARFDVAENDELQPVKQAFNKMASLLTSSIARLTHSDTERKNFIATISHDLRTPLSIARGYTETLMLKIKNELPLEEREMYFRLIHNKLLQIEDLVKKLFELSKMEDVAFIPNKEVFVITEIVQETVNTFQLLASEKQISLQCHKSVDHIWVNADIGMMERVIQNLVDNAIKNTPDGGFVNALIKVENGLVEISIENDGPAISDNLEQWIYNFEQSVLIADKRPRGAGLGLLIVQKILQLHDTSLKTSRQEGKNLFYFQLPIHRFDAAQVL